MGSWISSIDIYVFLWLIVAIVFGVIEFATVGLVTIWFAAGALAALALAAFGAGAMLQIFVFLIVSIVLLFLTRPLARKYINGRAPRTNVDAVIGARARVTEPVNNLNQTGRAVVNGQDWSIRAEDDTMTIGTGTLVEVIRVNGVKLVVKVIKED